MPVSKIKEQRLDEGAESEEDASQVFFSFFFFLSVLLVCRSIFSACSIEQKSRNAKEESVFTHAHLFFLSLHALFVHARSYSSSLRQPWCVFSCRSVHRERRGERSFVSSSEGHRLPCALSLFSCSLLLSHIPPLPCPTRTSALLTSTHNSRSRTGISR